MSASRAPEEVSTVKHFIKTNIEFVQVNEYLRDKLQNAGYGGIVLQRTPLGVRVTVKALKVGMVIGRRGRSVRQLTEELSERFGLHDPQIEVKGFETDALLNPYVAASRLVSQIQRGFHHRRAGYSLLRRIMAAGARGCEIVIKGRMASQRARQEIFRDGFVAKCGYPAQQYVEEAVTYVIRKQGAVGIHVRIMRPDAIMPDEVYFREDVIKQLREEMERRKEEEERRISEKETTEAEAETTERAYEEEQEEGTTAETTPKELAQDVERELEALIEEEQEEGTTTEEESPGEA